MRRQHCEKPLVPIVDPFVSLPRRQRIRVAVSRGPVHTPVLSSEGRRKTMDSVVPPILQKSSKIPCCDRATCTTFEFGLESTTFHDRQSGGSRQLDVNNMSGLPCGASRQLESPIWQDHRSGTAGQLEAPTSPLESPTCPLES